MKGWLVVQRGMLESVETVFRKITRTGARCRSLKVARDLTSVGLVHHRAWSLRSTVRGRRPIILARGILHKISPFFAPVDVSTLMATGRVVGFHQNRSTSIIEPRFTRHSHGKDRGVKRSWIFFENTHPSSCDGIVELFGEMPRMAGKICLYYFL